MALKLNRPIVFFDLETTGIKVDSVRIVQISLLKYNPDGTEEIKTLLVIPSIPIPKEAADINIITAEMVKDEPTEEILNKDK
ncbi:MAG: hypothetical protein K9J16_00055 [Melioribacteraceae bacterium]|nr:hypothetical protein [Melioribacteraceae bacterium]MCF8353901.1 hypothetical protein [Melioribacteraceae bacterium]MCF8392658.1 hypothetical protein [Melioribacteraceae bacterium]MCF8417679.1 hypothetical protein [Melioribacteraceae bacterium]